MPDVRVEIAWTTDTSNSDMWLFTDVTPWVEWQDSVKISRRRQHELDQVTPGTLTLTLDNSDGRFTAARAASPYYPHVKINRPIRVRAYWPPSRNLLARNASFSVSVGSRTTTFVSPPPGADRSEQWSAGVLAGAASIWLGTSALTTATNQANPVTPGQTYTFSVQVKSTVAVSIRPIIRWYGLDGAFIIQSGSPSFTPLTSSYQGLSVTATAPTGAFFARVVLTTTGTTGSATTINAGAWQLEAAAAPSAYELAELDRTRYQGFVDKWPAAWWNGWLSRVALTATDLQKLLSRQRLTNVGWITDNQLSGARIEGLLAAAQAFFSFNTLVDTGASVLGLSGQEFEQSIMASIRAAAVSEGGVFFIAGGGYPRFYDREHRQRPVESQSPAIELSADQLGTDLTFVLDDVLLMNEVIVTGAGGIEADPYVDLTSMSSYGTYSGRFETLLKSLSECEARAAFMALQYADPQPRVGRVSLEARTQPSLWSVLLGSDIGRRLQITDLPPEAPDGVLNLWIEGLQETITDESWTFAFDTSPASLTAGFILNDANYGFLDENRLGW